MTYALGAEVSGGRPGKAGCGRWRSIWPPFSVPRKTSEWRFPSSPLPRADVVPHKCWWAGGEDGGFSDGILVGPGITIVHHEEPFRSCRNTHDRARTGKWAERGEFASVLALKTASARALAFRPLFALLQLVAPSCELQRCSRVELAGARAHTLPPPESGGEKIAWWASVTTGARAPFWGEKTLMAGCRQRRVPFLPLPPPCWWREKMLAQQAILCLLFASYLIFPHSRNKKLGSLSFLYTFHCVYFLAIR